MMILSLKDQLQISTNNKYPGGTPGQKRKYHDDRELFYLSEKILEWFYNDEMGIIIIHGQQGYGKSTYACISCAEVYGHELDEERFYYNWAAVKKHIVWHPKHFIAISKKKPLANNSCYKIHPRKKRKEPMIVWDDAGYFLNSMDYRDKFCIAVSKYLEVARPRWGAIVFTCSMQQQILSKIRGIPHAWSVPIKKPAGTPSRFNKNYKWQHDRRFAKLHKSWCSEDLKKYGKKGKEGDIFYARMPPKFYDWYTPFREMFEEKGIEAVDVAAENLQLY